MATTYNTVLTDKRVQVAVDLHVRRLIDRPLWTAAMEEKLMPSRHPKPNEVPDPEVDDEVDEFKDEARDAREDRGPTRAELLAIENRGI